MNSISNNMKPFYVLLILFVALFVASLMFNHIDPWLGILVAVGSGFWVGRWIWKKLKLY